MAVPVRHWHESVSVDKVDRDLVMPCLPNPHILDRGHTTKRAFGDKGKWVEAETMNATGEPQYAYFYKHGPSLVRPGTFSVCYTFESHHRPSNCLIMPPLLYDVILTVIESFYAQAPCTTFTLMASDWGARGRCCPRIYSNILAQCVCYAIAAAGSYHRSLDLSFRHSVSGHVESARIADYHLIYMIDQILMYFNFVEMFPDWPSDEASCKVYLFMVRNALIARYESRTTLIFNMTYWARIKTWENLSTTRFLHLFHMMYTTSAPFTPPPLVSTEGAAKLSPDDFMIVLTESGDQILMNKPLHLKPDLTRRIMNARRNRASRGSAGGDVTYTVEARTDGWSLTSYIHNFVVLYHCRTYDFSNLPRVRKSGEKGKSIRAPNHAIVCLDRGFRREVTLEEFHGGGLYGLTRSVPDG